MTLGISCDPKGSHDRSAWSTCSTEISGTVLFVSHTWPSPLWAYTIFSQLPCLSLRVIHPFLSFPFYSIPFSARDYFLSILFALLPFYSILFTSMFVRDLMDCALYMLHLPLFRHDQRAPTPDSRHPREPRRARDLRCTGIHRSLRVPLRGARPPQIRCADSGPNPVVLRGPTDEPPKIP